jgi:predicted dinucleotide-utilizing enzyme
MKNVWKGLVIGAFTGAGIGWVLDLLDGGAKKLVAAEGRVEEAVQQHAPQVAARVRQGVSETVSRVQDADLPEQLREVADATKRKVEVPEKLKGAAGATRQKVARAAKQGSSAATSITS